MPHAILLTWQISFDQIKRNNPDAAELLSLMSVLDRQGISRSLLDKGDLLSFTESIAPVHNCALITIDVWGMSFGMHRLPDRYEDVVKVTETYKKQLELEHLVLREAMHE